MQKQRSKEVGEDWEDNHPEAAKGAITSFSEQKDETSNSISGKIAKVIARHPRTLIFGTIGVVFLISVLSFFLSDFELATENKKGWKSRGTPIAKRGMQSDIIRNHANELFNDTDGDLWKTLTSEVLVGNFGLKEQLSKGFVVISPEEINKSSDRRMEDECDLSWQSSGAASEENNLMALWESVGKSLLEPDIIEAVCDIELQTLSVLEEKELCGGCTNKQCLHPASLIWVLRNNIGAESFTCAQLAQAYVPYQYTFTEQLANCADELKTHFGVPRTNSSCPFGFSTFFVDGLFGSDNTFLRYSSSFYHTSRSDSFELFEAKDNFEFDSDLVKVFYDTSFDEFEEFAIDELIMTDLFIAAASGFMCVITIAIHTGSVWLVCMGLAQIVLAIPLSYAVYRFIFGLEFFSMLNLIGLFISVALGADDIFVSTDKWKNARLKNPEKSTEDIAVIALPDSATAMLLTTLTTAVAFFASCVSPVAPIYCFAVFCGLMVAFNYVLNCALVFPALCLYDKWILDGTANKFIKFTINCKWNKSTSDTQAPVNEKDFQLRPIQSMMESYYNILHRGRWLVLFFCTALLAVTTYYARTLSFPEDTRVRMLPTSNPAWVHATVETEDLLSSFLKDLTTGSLVEVYFGVVPADNGDRNNPDSLSSLQLDNNFDPSTTDAQLFLVEFCDRLLSNEFVYKSSSTYTCSMNRFDKWLEMQALLPEASKEPEYNYRCQGAKNLPMPAESFHSCFIYWSNLTSDTGILHWNDKVRIITVPVGTIMGYNNPLGDTRAEWEFFESFQEEELRRAPKEAQFFHTSSLWWWNDTYRSMSSTGLSALYIAISFAALIILISSRSLVCALVSALSIFFILVTATASLVGLGWELGFLECICFAILVGISADFVIHLSHSYTHLPAHRYREERTKYALMNMGSSILGATATTIAVAFMMLFCNIVFFIKFAQLLIITILYSLLGGFAFYAVVMDIMGPAEPTRTFDTVLLLLSNRKNVSSSSERDSDSA